MKQRAETVSAAGLAVLLKVDRTVVARLASEGFLSKLADGRYDEREALLGYIRHLRERAKERAPSAAQSRLQDARAKKLELEMSVRSGELIPLDDAMAGVDFVIGGLRIAFAGLPARVTREVDLRRKIEAEIDACLTAACDNLNKTREAIEHGVNPLDYSGASKSSPAKGKRKS